MMYEVSLQQLARQNGYIFAPGRPGLGDIVIEPGSIRATGEHADRLMPLAVGAGVLSLVLGYKLLRSDKKPNVKRRRRK